MVAVYSLSPKFIDSRKVNKFLTNCLSVFRNGVGLVFFCLISIGLILVAQSAIAESITAANAPFEQEKASLQVAIVKAKNSNDTEQIIRLREQLIDLTEKEFGSDSVEVAAELAVLGKAIYDQGKYDLALPLYRRALTIKEKVLGPEHPDVASLLNNLAIAYGKLAKYDQALLLHQRALAIREEALGLDHRDVAGSLNGLANTYRSLARYDEAVLMFKRALSIKRKVLGPEHPNIAITLNNLALTYAALAQYDQALPLYQRALVIFEKARGPEHPDVGGVLQNLANTYLKIAEYKQAIAHYQRTLAIFEKALGSEHPYLATTLNNLASTYLALAQYDQALVLHQRALVIREKALGSDHPDLGSTLNNIANIHYDLAQYSQALPLYQRALTIYEKSLGQEHPAVATLLQNLATAYTANAQYERGLTLYQRALSIREKELGPEHPDVARSLNNLANTYEFLAQYDQALVLHQRALLIREKVLGSGHPDVATSLNNLANTYKRLAQYDEALPLYRRALAIRERALGAEHPHTGDSYQGLGDFYKKQSLPDVAITFYKLAVNVRQSTRERVRRIGTAELESYTRSVETVYQDLAAVLTEEGRLAEAQEVLKLLKEDELFEFIHRSETKDLVRNKIKPTPAEQRWITQYRAIADQLFALGQEEQALEKIPAGELTATQRQRLAQIKSDLKMSNQAFTQFMGELKAMVAASKQQRSADVEELSQTAQSETREILQALGDEVALVQYFMTDSQLGMLLTTARLQKAYNTKIVAKELNLKIKQFLLLLKDPRGNPQKLADELYQLLFAPMAADLAQAGIRTVMISGDGALRYVPFAALHDGKEYLVTRYTLPTYTSVMRHNLKEPSLSMWTGAGLGVTQAHGDLKALPAVRDELHSIMGTAMPGEIYLDQAFTAWRLQEVGRQRLPVVHIASHFQFSPGTELNSFLLLGDGSQLNLGAFRTGDYQLTGVDLLTLSACETGLGGGRDDKGREIEGFGVIAQQKGAKAVIATLWPVEDTSTSMLMTTVYRNRQTQGLSKIEALRQAQLNLKRQPKYAHPYYWAPFILMGNWR